jgi:hypothetical protein
MSVEGTAKPGTTVADPAFADLTERERRRMPSPIGREILHADVFDPYARGDKG